MLPLWTFFIKKRQFSALLMIALIGAGFYSLLNIPKESAPEVRIPVGIVTTILPGASAEDIEQLVTKEVEDSIANLENLSKLTSTSREGVSSVVVEFTASADLDKSIQDLKDAVDTAKPDLPREAEDPIVSDVNFAEQPVLLISITGSLPPAALTQLADDVKDELQTVQGVSRVSVSGVRDREVQVIVQKDKLDQYGFTLSDVTTAIQSANASLPIGSITVDGVEYALNFEGELASIDDVYGITLRSRNNTTVYLRDVADIVDGLTEASTISRASAEGEPPEPSLSLAVYKSSGGNIAAVAENVRTKLDELKGGLLADSNVVISLDQGEQVAKDLWELSKTGLQTIALVMLVLLFTIGWREAIVAALSIPLSFLIAFIGLWASGNTINFVSLFSLILAIGILVDSGIVVTEAIHTRMRLYKTKEEAAIASLKEYAWPLIGGTMTTVAVFAPLFFISGIIGEFIKSIPFTIIFVLMASIFVALGLVPLIAIMFTKQEKSALAIRQEAYTDRAREVYKRWLSNFLDSRRAQNYFLLSIILGLVLAFALPITGLVKSVFFPQEDIDFIYVEIEKPQGTALEETDIVTRRVEEALYGHESIESFATTVGAGSQFNENAQSGSHVANVSINLAEDREKTSTEIVTELRKELAVIPGAIIRVFEPSSGPPSGAPVVITFSGNDLGALENTTLRAERLLREVPGTTEITSSVTNSSTEFVISIDRAKAAQSGLTPAQIAQTLRIAVHGATATTIKNPENDLEVLVKLDLNPAYDDPSQTTNVSVDAIRNFTMQTANGPVLLGSFVNIDVQKSKASIRHEDRKRIETVSSFLTGDMTAPEASAAFKKLAEEQLVLPSGVAMQVGGETEDIDQSFREMGFAFIAGIVLMLAILVLEFNSFRHTLYLLTVIPLSLIGVFAGLFITNQPLSFSSLLGVIALSGVIINHAIILLDSMHRIYETEKSFTFKEVVVEASASRLRPIVLTTLTTVVGMIPLSLVSSLWGPLAFAIMFGLAFSTILTLALIPLLSYRWAGRSFEPTVQHAASE